jgi:dethiobiotin synthetase
VPFGWARSQPETRNARSAVFPSLFVTGTDTAVGKTVAAVALIQAIAATGARVVGMKPVSAGVDAASGVNEDVRVLDAASNVRASLRDRNPFTFDEPAAPHLVAARLGVAIDLQVIRAAFDRLRERADVVVVEGAGGALVPIDDRRDMLDVARALALPVVLVVGVRLGCLNHARLAAVAIRARGLRLAGWIACRVDPAMAHADENVRWLARELSAPLIADLSTANPPPLAASALAMLR